MRNRKHDIEKYLKGELSPTEMHALEKEALSDPFLAEALEGVEQTGADNFLFDLHKINRSVHDRMRMKARKNSKVVHIWGWTSAVAATILLVVVSGFIVVNLLRDQTAREQTIAQSQPPPSQPADSATAEEEKMTTDESTTVTVEEPSPKGNDEVTEKPLRADRAEAKRTPVQEQPATAMHDRLRDSGAIAQLHDIGETSHQEGARAAAETITRRSNPSEVKVIKGRVTDDEGRELPGVNVIVKSTETGTLTNAQGAYEVVVPNDETTLVFNFIGFEPKEVTVTDERELNVELEENVVTLSEVVVTGYREKKAAEHRSLQVSEPAGGKDDFKSYLREAVKYPQEAIRNKIEGKVTVQFTIGPSGEPTDFEVLKGIGYGCEEALIRAIREGPSWKPGMMDSKSTSDKVRVKYRFKLSG